MNIGETLRLKSKGKGQSTILQVQCCSITSRRYLVVEINIIAQHPIKVKLLHIYLNKNSLKLCKSTFPKLNTVVQPARGH